MQSPTYYFYTSLLQFLGANNAIIVNNSDNKDASKQYSLSSITSKSTVIDSGSTSHHCTDETKFTTVTKTNRVVELADGSPRQIVGVGDVTLKHKDQELTLKGTNLTPECAKALIRFDVLSLDSSSSTIISIFG